MCHVTLSTSTYTGNGENPAAVSRGVGAIFAEITGYQVKQTRAAVRVAQNAPDDFEREALGRFAADPALLEYWRQVEQEGRRGAISVVLPMDESIARLRRNAITQVWAVAERTRELEQANQARTRFLAMVSHELRTPLTSIIAFTELLLKQATGLQQEYLEDVLESSRNLLDMVNNLLDLSRLKAGRVQLFTEVHAGGGTDPGQRPAGHRRLSPGRRGRHGPRHRPRTPRRDLRGLPAGGGPRPLPPRQRPRPGPQPGGAPRRPHLG